MAVDDIRSVGVEVRIKGIGGFPRVYSSCDRGTYVYVYGKRNRGIPRIPMGTPSTGLNDNSDHSITLKRSFALVCMYYDHLYLSGCSRARRNRAEEV